MRKPLAHREERWRQEEIGNAIIQYLAEHPKASDTLEGIAEWWIMRHHVRVEVDMLAKALLQLTEKGVLEVIGKGDSRCYRLKVTE